MKVIQSNSVGVTQGSQTLFSDFIDDGPMWSGQGDRESRFNVRFPSRYLAIPSVIVSIGMWDIDNGHNIRSDISAQNVTEVGFDIVFRTWGDTRLARVRADWIAFGPVASPDDWSLQET